MDRLTRLIEDDAVDPVLFYAPKDNWGVFSNFSKHTILLPDPFTGSPYLYRTSEHRYQAMKATSKDDHDYVAAVERCTHTKDRGREIELRDGWGNDYGDLCWYVMVEALMAKYDQHVVFRRAVDNTNNRMIYEDSPVDDVWGWRFQEDYRGKNLLGRAIMYVREHKA